MARIVSVQTGVVRPLMVGDRRVLSAIGKTPVGGAVAVLLGLVALLPLLRWLLIEYGVRPGHTGSAAELAARFRWMLLVNPVVTFMGAMETLGRGAPNWRALGVSLGIQHALAWSALGVSCLLLPRSWQDRAEVRVRPRSGAGLGDGEGVGAARRVSAVRWNVAKDIVTAWIVTMPAAGLIAAVFYFLGGAFGMT